MLLSNDVSCESYVSRSIHRCAIGFPSQISSALVAEKNGIMLNDDTHLLHKLSGLHCVPFQCATLLKWLVRALNTGVIARQCITPVRKMELYYQLFPGLTGTQDLYWKPVHCLPDVDRIFCFPEK